VYFIGMADGGLAYATYVNNANGERARCVRSVINRETSATISRFHYANGEKLSAVDTWTNLQWQVTVTDLVFQWNEQAKAVQFCKDLHLDGAADWRLPTNKESVSMMDERRAGPCVDISIFPQQYNGWLWNSNPNLFFGASWGWAWSSSDGVNYVQSSPGQMRCVRTPGATTTPCSIATLASLPQQPCALGCCGGNPDTKVLVRLVLAVEYSQFQCADWLESARSALTNFTLCSTSVGDAKGLVAVSFEMEPSDAQAVFDKAKQGTLAIPLLKSVVDPTTGATFQPSGLSGGAIAGIVIALLVVAAAVAVVLVLVYRHKSAAFSASSSGPDFVKLSSE
jgi:hypothetical protein